MSRHVCVSKKEDEANYIQHILNAWLFKMFPFVFLSKHMNPDHDYNMDCQTPRIQTNGSGGSPLKGGTQ